MAIYKILRGSEWDALQAAGRTAGAPIDVADGFVHLSTAEQVEETAARHFAGQAGLILAAMDEAQLGDTLRWEVSRGGASFPHLYRDLLMTDVLWSAPLPWQDERHVFPPL